MGRTRSSSGAEVGSSVVATHMGSMKTEDRITQLQQERRRISEELFAALLDRFVAHVRTLHPTARTVGVRFRRGELLPLFVATADGDLIPEAMGTDNNGWTMRDLDPLGDLVAAFDLDIESRDGVFNTAFRRFVIDLDDPLHPLPRYDISEYAKVVPVDSLAELMLR